MSQDGQDYIVAVVIGTEVPPPGTTTLTDAPTRLAIRAVCDVIRNRVADGSFGKNAVEVVLAPKQFSAVCRQDYWRRAMAGLWFPQHVAACLTAWQMSAGFVAQDALYYYSPISMVPKGAEPKWLMGKTEVLVPGLDRDFFRFYR